jgi:hypothetical protein
MHLEAYRAVTAITVKITALFYSFYLTLACPGRYMTAKARERIPEYFFAA